MLNPWNDLWVALKNMVAEVADGDQLLPSNALCRDLRGIQIGQTLHGCDVQLLQRGLDQGGGRGKRNLGEVRGLCGAEGIQLWGEVFR